MVLHKQGGSTTGLIETDTWDPLLLCVWAKLARKSVVKSQQQSQNTRDNISEGGEGKTIISPRIALSARWSVIKKNLYALSIYASSLGTVPWE